MVESSSPVNATNVASCLPNAARELVDPTSVLKRALDLLITIPLCVFLLPLFLAISLSVKADSKGPVFFIQKRRGRFFREFRVIKFRTLRHGAPDPCQRYEMLERDPRITLAGAVLRRTSLDELPQLFNVLAGSMSLVGPRPLVEWESQDCLKKYAERFRVKPGITGLSQVAVRNSVDFDARANLDVEYVTRWNMWLDMRILISTPPALISGKGIYPKPTAKERKSRAA